MTTTRYATGMRPGEGGHAAPEKRKPLHTLAMEIMAMVDDPSTSVSRLAGAIAEDRHLRDKVLRIANSPLLGLPQRISTVEYAVTLLGFRTLRDTVMRLMVNGAFRRMVDAVVNYEGFWNHAISCGVAARILARRHASALADDAFLAGLFHDIGFLLQQPGLGDSLLVAGAAVRTATHEELGGWLADRWRFGEHITDAIRWHHSPGRATVRPELAAIVHVADVLCFRLDIGASPFERMERSDPDALRILGIQDDDLSPARLERDAAQIRAHVARAPSFASIVSGIKYALVEQVGSLSERERLTLALHYQEGLSFEDIGRVLGASTADVQASHEGAVARLSTVIHHRI